MQSCLLLEVDGCQSGDCQRDHGDESCKLSKDDGKEDEAEETDSDSNGCQGKEASSDAHELKWFLQSFEDGISVIV